MNSGQGFLIVIGVMFFLFAYQNIKQAWQDKNDPMYGQCVAAAIWQSLSGIVCLLLILSK